MFWRAKPKIIKLLEGRPGRAIKIFLAGRGPDEVGPCAFLVQSDAAVCAREGTMRSLPNM